MIVRYTQQVANKQVKVLRRHDQRLRIRHVPGQRPSPPRKATVAAAVPVSGQQEQTGGRNQPPNNVLDPGGKFRRRALLWWPKGVPHSVLIVKKRNDADASYMLQCISDWLQANGLRVFVEEQVRENEFPNLDSWSSELDIPDFCVTLGGDGTVLHTASLFRQEAALPPVTAFAMGTLGFLTPFEASNFEPLLSRVVRANEQAVFCTLRTRLVAEVFSGGQCVATHHAFNEACIDRGPAVNFLQLDAYIDGSYVTTIQGDGLIVATPSGSTAYSMSAGGPMVAPSVPCMLLTPIAPHSLSFRPVVVAESSDIVINVPTDFSDAEEPARVSFDGKNTTPLGPGDSVRLSIARWPLPMITAETMDLDWFVSITEKLMWNAVIKRHRRKGLPDTLPTSAALDVLNRSTDECSLDVAGCVLLPPAAPVGAPQAVRPAGGHHTGQALQEIDASMPIYRPNTADPADCLAVWRGSLSGMNTSNDLEDDTYLPLELQQQQKNHRTDESTPEQQSEDGARDSDSV